MAPSGPSTPRPPTPFDARPRNPRPLDALRPTPLDFPCLVPRPYSSPDPLRPPSTPPTHRTIVLPTSSTAILSIPIDRSNLFDPSISRPFPTLVPFRPSSPLDPLRTLRLVNPSSPRPTRPPSFRPPDVLRFLDALRSPPLSSVLRPIDPRPSTLDPRPSVPRISRLPPLLGKYIC